MGTAREERDSLTLGQYSEARAEAVRRGYYGIQFDAYPCCLEHLDELYPLLIQEGVADTRCQECRNYHTGIMLNEAEYKQPSRLNGVVFYDGPSLLNGKRIVAVATNIMSPSENSKTGDGGARSWLVQTWILPTNVNPVKAARTGADEANCGSCALRHHLKGSCYVNLGQAPLSVYRAWKRGSYPNLDEVDPSRFQPRVTASGKLVGDPVMPLRRGSYGDPAAVPEAAWKALEQALYPEGLGRLGTGYTHQWKGSGDRAAGLAKHHMASIGEIVPGESDEDRKARIKADYDKAHEMGFRTFRVRKGDEPLMPGEMVCPASEEGGKTTTCSKCPFCTGTHLSKNLPNIAIYGHGSEGKKHFKTRDAIKAAQKPESIRATTARVLAEGWTPDGYDPDPEVGHSMDPAGASRREPTSAARPAWTMDNGEEVAVDPAINDLFTMVSSGSRLSGIQHDLAELYKDREMNPNDIYEAHLEFLDAVLGRNAGAYTDEVKSKVAEKLADLFMKKFYGVED